MQTATQLWDIASGKERMRFPVKDFGILSVAFSPDGKRLYAGVTDQTIRVYDLTAGREMTPPLNHEHALKSLPKGEVPAEAGGFCHVMNRLTFSPDGSVLAAAASQTDYTGPSVSRSSKSTCGTSSAASSYGISRRTSR